MSVTIRETENKEDRSLWEKDIRDLLESPGWKLLSYRLAEYRRESLAKLMVMDCESKVYRTEIKCYDHALSIPDEIMAESLESKRLQNEEYHNIGDRNEKQENKEEPKENGCKCPNCGASLMITVSENNPEDEQSFSKLDEEDQRSDMEKDFKKRVGGELEEYD